MSSEMENEGKMLLHACCGPCSMEPVRVLRERGIEPEILYANSNIAPVEEYAHRLETIRAWTAREGVAFFEDDYEPSAWGQAVKDALAEDENARTPHDSSRPHEERCRACYRQRFDRAAAYAAQMGYESLGTTLTISPYQYTDIIAEELERACAEHGIQSAFEDYSDLYAEATRRSREEGLYRQDFCGCAFSKREADKERAERAAAREERKARRAAIRAQEEAQLRERKAERAAYDSKRAHQREILKALRAENAHVESSESH